MSSHEAELPVLHLPVQGVWRVLRSPGHAKFAFDLAAVDRPGGRTLKRSRLDHLMGRMSASDAHGWEQRVRSPVAGTVVRALDQWPDRRTLHLLKDSWRLIAAVASRRPMDPGWFAGNHVIVEGEGIHVLLAHLRDGSLRVREGDRVEAGTPVGRVGNSGASLEPHLHCQLLDRIDDLAAASAPGFVVAHYDRWTGGAWTTMEMQPLRRGDIIRSVPAAPPPSGLTGRPGKRASPRGGRTSRRSPGGIPR
jgi:hypothetical protein